MNIIDLLVALKCFDKKLSFVFQPFELDPSILNVI